MRNRLLNYVMLLIFSHLMACNGTNGSLASAEALINPLMTAAAGKYTELQATPAFAQMIAQRGARTWTAVGQTVGADASPQYEIAGVPFAHLDQLYIKSREGFANMQAKYGTYQGYWRAIGLDQHVKITPADLQRGLRLLSDGMAVRLAGGAEQELSAADQLAVAKVGFVELALHLHAATSSLALVPGEEAHDYSVSGLPPPGSMHVVAYCGNSGAGSGTGYDAAAPQNGVTQKTADDTVKTLADGVAKQTHSTVNCNVTIKGAHGEIVSSSATSSGT